MVPYLQVAVSLVVSVIVVLVVPAVRLPEGAGLERTGGVVSVTAFVRFATCAVPVFPEGSVSLR